MVKHSICPANTWVLLRCQDGADILLRVKANAQGCGTFFFCWDDFFSQRVKHMGKKHVCWICCWWKGKEAKSQKKTSETKWLGGPASSSKSGCFGRLQQLLFFFVGCFMDSWHKGASKLKAEHLVFLRHLPGRPKKKASRTRSSRRKHSVSKVFVCQRANFFFESTC